MLIAITSRRSSNQQSLNLRDAETPALLTWAVGRFRRSRLDPHRFRTRSGATGRLAQRRHDLRSNHF